MDPEAVAASEVATVCHLGVSHPMEDIRGPDGELVEAVLVGRPGAFERLVREHQRLCWHIIIRMVRNPEDARELCQDTFLRVHRRLHQYRFESRLKSWIGRIAYSIAVRHMKRQRIPLAGQSEDTPSLIENVGCGPSHGKCRVSARTGWSLSLATATRRWSGARCA